MKNCTHCKWAEWDRTEKGRLHPSGNGMCGFQVKMPTLPAAYFWFLREVGPHGGQINRRLELHSDCPTFAWKQDERT